MSSSKGTVFWITGLSGAGKTTIGKLLYEKIRSAKENVVFLDGDILREVFGNDLGYSAEDRRVSAGRNARICKMLGDQGIDVVCCTISMFEEVRKWNRQNNTNYREIYLKVPVHILENRNQKGMYSNNKSELVGFGVDMEEPENPDMIFENDGSKTPEEIVQIMYRSYCDTQGE